MSNWQNFDAPNLGLLFYKRLYQESSITKLLGREEKEGIHKLTFNVNEKVSEFDVFYKAMYDQKIGKYQIQNDLQNLLNAKFSLLTTYPGLLIGTGYNHGTKSTGDATIGFYFDHVTGLPTIPGSSVKGLLRSAFPQWTIRKEESAEKKKAKTCWIEALLLGKKIEDIEFSDTLKGKIHKLEIAIFGETDEGGKDVFFDAIIDKEKTVASCFLDKDFITPHIKEGMSHEQAMLKNPTPLQLLKVRPNIAFQFCFKLTNEGCSIAEKEKIFREILLTMGIGAKTNVGYGQFKNEKEGVSEISTEDNNLNDIATIPINAPDFRTLRADRDKIEAKVIDNINNTLKLQLFVKNYPNEFLLYPSPAASAYQIGTILKLQVRKDRGNIYFKL